MLEIAIAHAEAGRQVLFTCYNKVLGASLRSSLTARAVPKSVADRVLVADVFALRKELKDNGLLDALEHSFGTICVDEAQDMGNAHFEFLQLLAAPSVEWFIADGEGQELYDPTSEFLKDAREHGIKQTLNRRFRGTNASQLVAQAVFDTELDRAKIDKWVKEKPLGEGEDTLDIGVDKAGGLPTIRRIDRNVYRSRKDAYAEAIEQELATLKRLGAPNDLTVMVSRKSDGEEVGAVRAALDMIGVQYLDQIQDENRRRTLPPDHVRLSTIHSARGIESTRALVFARGHEFWGKVGLMPERVARNAGYIGLSRAKHGTTVVLVDGDQETPFSLFLAEIVSAYAPGIDSA